MALTFKQSQIVKGSIPTLREHGETIATIFYANMLREHPELHDLFNNVNQANGRQPRALHAVILTFASNINNISELIPKLERMCNKHCSLGIYPEHYDIVGKYLLQAFGQVLGPSWTPELQLAWKLAYSTLARMMISREAQMYREFESWQGWRRFKIDRKVMESESIYSFYLVPCDGRRLPEFQPGQYTSVRMQVPSLGCLQSRQYSLSDSYSPDFYRVSIKKDPGLLVGKGVEAIQFNPGLFSNMMCDDKEVGDTVELTHPSGDFHLDVKAESTMPVVLISAGVGVTPLMSILNTVVERQAKRPISWIHCSARKAPFEDHVRRIAQTRADFAMRFFRSKMADFDDGSSTASGEEGLRMDLARIEPEQLYLTHGGAEYYICGPEAFELEMAKFLISRGVDRTRVKYEWFTTGELAA